MNKRNFFHNPRNSREQNIFEESITLKNKISDQQNQIEELYLRISALEEIEKKYYSSLKEQDNTDTSETHSPDEYLAKIEILQKKLSCLREENYCLRDTDDKERLDEMNSISFFEHRFKNAIISQLALKVTNMGHSDHQKHNFHRFTSKELIELNHAEPKVIEELILETENDVHLLRRHGVDRLLKNIRRLFDEKHLLLNHNITDLETIAKLKYLTNNALKFFNLLPPYIQKDLIEKIHNYTHPRVWNGAFIKGYYFLSKILETESGHQLLHDVKFHTESNDVKVIFKETLYEIFGNFVYIDKHQLYVTSGIPGMAKMLKNIKHDSIIKGLFGELIAAYYYKKAYELEILEVQKKIETAAGTVGEIDIIAIDKNYNLWDIEVKNWQVTSILATETLLAKVTDQLRSPARIKFVNALKNEYEQARGIKIKAIHQRAILVKDTPYKAHIQKIQNNSSIIFDVVDLVPAWLTKGVYGEL